MARAAREDLCSSVTRFMVAAQSRMMPSPTATEPVNEIFATSGWRTTHRLKAILAMIGVVGDDGEEDSETAA